MPDAMTRLLANVGLSDLERRLRDEAIDETTFLDLDYKNRAKKATARADELDRVLASVLAHSQHLEAELATLRSMPRLLVRGSTAPPVTPGDGDSAY